MVGEDQVTDEQIQQWADEAEAGYDVEELKRRRRGRPGRGAAPGQVIAVRVTAEEIAALDAYAARDLCRWLASCPLERRAGRASGNASTS